MSNIPQFDKNRKKAFAQKLKDLISGWEASHPGEKLSQQRLGDAISGSRESVSGWLTGKSYPNSSAISALCDFFSVSPQYFDPEAEDLFTNEQRHREYSAYCKQLADHIGLRESFVRFVKESPGLADLVVKASWVNPVYNPPDKDVPRNPDDSPYQFESSNGVRVYLPDDVLYMLRCVQRDAEEYSAFLLQKYSQTISDHHRPPAGTDPKRIRPIEQFSLNLDGMPSLSPDEAFMISVMRSMDDKGRKELAKQAAHIIHHTKGEKTE